jgi:hypothetical protein
MAKKSTDELVRAHNQILEGFGAINKLVRKRGDAAASEALDLTLSIAAPMLSIFVGIAHDLQRIANALEKTD